MPTKTTLDGPVKQHIVVFSDSSVRFYKRGPLQTEQARAMNIRVQVHNNRN